jgi:alpha-glucosidase (family GH31 glycosyl hydrolase)
VREYDTHNLFGTAMAHDHYRAFKAITGKRPFLLSRYDQTHPLQLNAVK